jgi:hypothetical protein
MSKKPGDAQNNLPEVLERLIDYQEKYLESDDWTLCHMYAAGSFEFLDVIGDRVWNSYASKYHLCGLKELKTEKDALLELVDQIQDPNKEINWLLGYYESFKSVLFQIVPESGQATRIWDVLKQTSGELLSPFKIQARHGVIVLYLSEVGAGLAKPATIISERRAHWDDPGIVIGEGLTVDQVANLIDNESTRLEGQTPALDTLSVDRYLYRTMVISDLVKEVAQLGTATYWSTMERFGEILKSHPASKTVADIRLRLIFDELVEVRGGIPCAKRIKPVNEVALYASVDTEMISLYGVSVSSGAYRQNMKRFFDEIGEKKPRGIDDWTKWCCENHQRFVT